MAENTAHDYNVSHAPCTPFRFCCYNESGLPDHDRKSMALKFQCNLYPGINAHLQNQRLEASLNRHLPTGYIAISEESIQMRRPDIHIEAAPDLRANPFSNLPAPFDHWENPALPKPLPSTDILAQLRQQPTRVAQLLQLNVS